jgi:hypothetical protein
MKNRCLFVQRLPALHDRAVVGVLTLLVVMKQLPLLPLADVNSSNLPAAACFIAAGEPAARQTEPYTSPCSCRS